jgi:hypothetical protein
MSSLIGSLASYIGMKSESVTACDAVEAGAVRRFAQATMDERAVYGEAGADSRYGAPVAPPLYPGLRGPPAFRQSSHFAIILYSMAVRKSSCFAMPVMASESRCSRAMKTYTRKRAGKGRWYS